MRIAAPIPILRSFDEEKAKRYYLDYLGFKVDWEHRFGPDMPLYMQVSLGDCVLHLSEHHGDATPGSAVRIECELDDYYAALQNRPHPNCRAGIVEQDWGMRELMLTDPFGNRLVFCEPIES